jgi:hypothetical protein
MASLNLTFDDILNADLLVGDASVVGDWNTFFDLPTYGTPFSAVTISGVTVQLFGGSNIIIKESLFDDPGGYGTHLLQVDDSAGSVIELQYDAFGYDQNSGCPNLSYLSLPSLIIAGDYSLSYVGINTPSLTVNLPQLETAGVSCFSYSTLITIDLPNLINIGAICFRSCQLLTTINLPSLQIIQNNIFQEGPFDQCTSLTTINIPNLTSAGDNCFNNSSSLTTINLPNLTTAGDFCFYFCTSLTTIDLPNLTTASSGCFYNCLSLTTIDLPKLTTAGDAFFNNCSSLTTINIPSCTDLGGTVGDDGVFGSITGNTITLTVPPVLMTCDGGSPDGDIQYLQANNTVTIVETTPTPSPTPTPTPTNEPQLTPVPSPTPSSTPLPPVPPGPSPTPSSTPIPLSGISVNIKYEYTAAMMGVYSNGMIVEPTSNIVIPHPVYTDENGVPYVQTNAITVGGFNGLNN